MSIKLAIDDHPPRVFFDDVITIGSESSCTVPFANRSDLKPKHAVIRMIAGRWLIEAREAESIFVGGSEPKRLHWLAPGDAIRLSETGPTVTFQPMDDESRPLLPDGDSSEVILPPDSDPLFLVPLPIQDVKPASSATIPVPKPPSESAIPLRDPQGLPANKPRLSGTIRTVKPEIAGGSDSQIPSKQASRPRSNSQIPVVRSSDDEPAGGVPVLKRLSSWDDDSTSFDALPQRRVTTSEQAEMKWIMMVVGRIVGAGVAVVIVLMTINALRSAFSPQSEVSPPLPPPTTTVQSPPPTNAGIPKTPAPETRPPTIPLVKPVKPKPETARPNTPTTKVPGGAPINEKKPLDDEQAMPDESASDPSRSSTSNSPNILAAQESIYAVIMESADKTHRIQVGTAWAASRRYLVTTATVVAAIEEHQQQGMIASAVHFATDKSYLIKTKKRHEASVTAAESAEIALEKRDDERYSKERATQLRFDIGVLDIGRNERLAHRLPIEVEPLKDSKDAAFVMVGLPFDASSGQSSADSDDSNSLKERRCKKPSGGTAIQDRQMGLTIQFTFDSKGHNWSGSPVLNKDQKVIGVYTQLALPTRTGGKPSKPVHGVAWIGRLNEVTSDIE